MTKNAKIFGKKEGEKKMMTSEKVEQFEKDVEFVNKIINETDDPLGKKRWMEYRDFLVKCIYSYHWNYPK